jgi:hypothetical protein
MLMDSELVDISDNFMVVVDWIIEAVEDTDEMVP